MCFFTTEIPEFLYKVELQTATGAYACNPSTGKGGKDLEFSQVGLYNETPTSKQQQTNFMCLL